MNAKIALRLKLSLILMTAMTGAFSLHAQQKGQYVPGQFGLNAGILPSPGFTYTNMEINYSTDSFNNPSGNAVPPKPTLNIWVVENYFTFVPNAKFRGGHLGFTIIVPTIANGSLTLEQVNFNGSTYGLADTWVQPLTVGWHLKRADILVGDAFVIPTGRYTNTNTAPILTRWVTRWFLAGPGHCAYRKCVERSEER